MKITLTNLKFTLLAACLLAGVGPAMGQGSRREFKLKKGDEFQRQIVIKSNCVLQRGSQRLNLSTYSSVTKTYKVTAISGGDAAVTITINKIIDSLNALGQKVAFNSDKRADPNSYIQMELLQMIGKSASLSINERGKIMGVQKQLPANDTLLSFTGIQNEPLKTGGQLEIASDFPASQFVKTGYTWTDSTATAVTRFTVYAANSRTTTITYTTNSQAGNLNSRINGVMLVDNETGVILKRSTQSVTTGYELVKGVIYTATRRTATSEVCYKAAAVSK